MKKKKPIEFKKPTPCIKHEKIFWLSQYREMKWQAEQIVKQGASPNYIIQTLIDDYHLGIIKSKEELKDLIFEFIKEHTFPRTNDNAQLNLF